MKMEAEKNVFIFGGAISRSGLRHVDKTAYGKLLCLQCICNSDKLKSSVPYDVNPAYFTRLRSILDDKNSLL